jgi:hypothetical protein
MAGAISVSLSLAVSLLVAASAFAAPKANLDQGRNGRATVPSDPVLWVDGNAGSSNSHYLEGWSIPYRLVMTGLPLNTQITVHLGYAIKRFCPRRQWCS